jgi:hypothetical protein
MHCVRWQNASKRQGSPTVHRSHVLACSRGLLSAAHGVDSEVTPLPLRLNAVRTWGAGGGLVVVHRGRQSQACLPCIWQPEGEGRGSPGGGGGGVTSRHT